MKRRSLELFSKNLKHRRSSGRKSLSSINNDKAPIGEGSNASSKNPTDNVAFCKLCANLTLAALRSDEGYPHVADIRELQGLSTWCSVCNLLKLGLFETARGYSRTDDDVDSMETALELLRILAEKQGTILRDICPLVLKVYSSPLGHIRVHYGTLGKHGETTGSPRAAMDISLGTLILHRDGDMSPPPLLPR